MKRTSADTSIEDEPGAVELLEHFKTEASYIAQRSDLKCVTAGACLATRRRVFSEKSFRLISRFTSPPPFRIPLLPFSTVVCVPGEPQGVLFHLTFAFSAKGCPHPATLASNSRALNPPNELRNRNSLLAGGKLAI